MLCQNKVYEVFEKPLAHEQIWVQKVKHEIQDLLQIMSPKMRSNNFENRFTNKNIIMFSEENYAWATFNFNTNSHTCIFR